MITRTRMSLERAIKYARLNPIKARGRNSISRFCSILTDGRTSFIGWNSYRTHPLQAKFSKDSDKVCTHSEISAISKAIKGAYRDLSGYTMYIARLLASGETGIAKPCQVCDDAIKYYGIGKVIYTG